MDALRRPAFLLLICLIQQIALASFSSALSMVSAPFVAYANISTTVATAGEDLGSINPILNSSNMNFSWGWVATPNSKFLLSIVYIPGSMASAAGNTDAQQVWIANRNQPVSNMASLQLEAGGNLLLKDIDGSIVWSTRTLSGAGIELQNSGNLVLLDRNGREVWQSFDHPCDTLLPGQVVRTGTQIISSRSYSNVSEGKYSVVMEPGGLIMYASTPSGPLPYHVVGFSPVDKNNTVTSVQQPSCNGTSFTYSLGGGILTFKQEDSAKPGCNQSFTIPVGSNDNNTNVYFRLDADGNFRTYVYRLHYGWGIDQEIFSGSVACALPSKCGSYGVCSSHGACSCPPTRSHGEALFHAINPSDPTSGCALSQPPSCNGSNQLIELNGTSYFADDFVYQSTSSLSECKRACATSCSCAVAFYRQSTGNCYHYQSVMSIQRVSDGSFYAFLKVGNGTANAGVDGSLTTQGGNSLSTKMILGIAIVAALVVGLCLLAFIALFLKIRTRMAEISAENAFLDSLPGLPTRFSFKELHKATHGFRMKLGSGGFGSVYEGHLGDGSKVAVKRLEGARQGQKEFHAEVAALGSINHLNLVRLRGFCARGSQRLLVYDHVANGSLDKWLFSVGDGSQYLDWSTRFSIAADTARGLAFLHEESRERIVHLDVKPQNILLDQGFTAKLADFGLSKLMDRGESDVVTNMRGTPGYVAPEWLLRAAVTSKSDVYSYGMVLLELVSGRRNLDLSRNCFWYFPAWAVMKAEEGKMMEIVDERLPKFSPEGEEEAARAIKVALWCIQEDPTVRPCMSTVLRMLEGHTEVEDPPSLMQFAMRTRSTNIIVSSSCSDDLHHGSHRTDTTESSLMSNAVLSAAR